HGASSPSPDELSWNRFTFLEAGSQTIEQRIVPDSASIHIAHGSGPLRPLQHVQTKTKSDFSAAKIFRAQSLRPPHACGCRDEAGVRGASFMTAAQKYPNGTASFPVRSSRRRERARNSITTTPTPPHITSTHVEGSGTSTAVYVYPHQSPPYRVSACCVTIAPPGPVGVWVRVSPTRTT